MDGVKVGDPVIKNNVLVGKIIEANFKSSQAILLTNINSRVPVRIGSMKYNAILNGHESEKNNLKLTFLPKEYSFVGGEIIYTTSIDGIMPEGLIIGEIKLDKNKKFYIQPFYEVNKLDLVSIINMNKEIIKKIIIFFFTSTFDEDANFIKTNIQSALMKRYLLALKLFQYL